jgi:hypothetical protein
VLVAFVMTAKYSVVGDEPSTPSGWTLIRSEPYTGNVRLTAFSRAWTSGSHSFSNPTNNMSAVIVVAVQGADEEAIASSWGETASGSPVVLQAVWAGEGDVLLSALASNIVTTAAADLTVPSGMTARGEVNPDAYDYGGGYYGVPTLGVASLDDLPAGSTGTKSWTIAGDFPDSVGFGVIVGAAATATEHDATATRATTVTLTSAAARETFASATSATTASVTAAADREAVATATAATTVGLTATAAQEHVVTATLAITATATATSPGVVTADATLATTATLAATASIPVAHDATATRATTVTIAAAATVLIGGVGAPGSMRPLDLAGATMRPLGTTGATMRTVLVGFNTATMRAVLDDSATAPVDGVLVFTGPTDPVTLGLVALTTPHVWFHDDTVTVREG